MNDLNSFLIDGVLVADPVLTTVTSGAKLCTFAIRSERRFMNKSAPESEISIFRVETWNRTAEFVASNVKKHFRVRVVGRARCFDGNFIVVGENIEIKRIVSTQTKGGSDESIYV